MKLVEGEKYLAVITSEALSSLYGAVDEVIPLGQRGQQDGWAMEESADLLYHFFRKVRLQAAEGQGFLQLSHLALKVRHRDAAGMHSFYNREPNHLMNT